MPILRYVSDKYIVLYDLQQDEVFVFNRNGKIRSHFKHMGQGGQEYINISNLFFDEKNEELFVSDFSTNRILVYSITGEYMRTIKYSKDFMYLYAYNFNDSTMLVYNNDINFLKFKNSFSQRPYMLMSKKDGRIISNIDIQLPVRYTNRISEQTKVGDQWIATAHSLDTYNNVHWGQDFALSDISSDTIYRLTRAGELSPILVRTPSVQSSQPPIVWANILTTDKFIILKTMILYDKEDTSSKLLMYEFESGQTYIPSFANDDFRGAGWYPVVVVVGVDTPKNMYIELVSAKILRILYKEMKLKVRKLENFKKIPDDDDNPGVMIVKFK